MKNNRYKKTSSIIAKRRKARRYVGIFLKISLPVAFFIGLVFLLRADFLQVKSFEVLSAETVQTESIKNAASDFISGTNFFLLPRSNILFLSKANLAAALLSKFGRLENVEVNKQFFSRSIKLSVSERKEDFLWCSDQGKCFFMTKDGFIFDLASFVVADKVIFRGLLSGNPLMKNFSTPEKMQNYLGFIEILKNAARPNAAGGQDFQISSINIESNDKATAKSNTGDIIFSPDEEDLSTVAQNVILLINNIKSKTPSAKFSYVDARFGNKIFYKLY